jgi:hypothetical protein
MSGPKEGDRVRVMLEGEVVSACRDSFYVSGSWVHFEGPGVSFEVLRPPVKVGDVIETAEELDALPVWTVIREVGPDDASEVYERRPDGWLAPGREVPDPPFLPATVLYLPDGAA